MNAQPPPVADLPDVDTVITQTLVPYGRMPGAVEVAALTDHLLTYGQQAIDRVSTLPEADRATFAGSVRDWEYLTATGPLDTSAGVANWTYTRGLARVVRNLTHALRAAT